MRTTEQLFWQLYRRGVGLMSRGYTTARPWLHRHYAKRAVSGYDPSRYGFAGGEFGKLTHRNYEKALANLWKAETKAPFLGFRDASKLERAAAQSTEEATTTRALVDKVHSDDVKKAFQDAYTPAQQQALGRILSVIGHGEAYALYTSSTLVSEVKGTGPRLGMAMQVMEEAKHFIVMREMLQTLEIAAGITPTVHVLFERIAAAPPYRRLFGMNIVLESLATSVFSRFANAPGLSHIMHPFHMDESRHVGFVRSYAQEVKIPRRVTKSLRERQARAMLVVPALPAIWEYREDFEVLGLDSFEFFGSTLNKIAKLAEEVGLPLDLPRQYFMLLLNGLFNAWVRAYEPARYNGFRDYCALHDEGGIPGELLAVERKLFGEEPAKVANH